MFPKFGPLAKILVFLWISSSKTRFSLTFCAFLLSTKYKSGPLPAAGWLRCTPRPRSTICGWGSSGLGPGTWGHGAGLLHASVRVFKHTGLCQRGIKKWISAFLGFFAFTPRWKGIPKKHASQPMEGFLGNHDHDAHSHIPQGAPFSCGARSLGS